MGLLLSLLKLLLHLPFLALLLPLAAIAGALSMQAPHARMHYFYVSR